MPETPPIQAAEPSPDMSLGGKLVNIFAAPSEVFEDVKARPTIAMGWLIPLFLMCLVSIIHVQIIFSQPAVLQKIKDQQEAKIQELVNQGKLTQDKADQAQEQIARFVGPSFLKIAGSFGAVINTFFITFLIALVIWLVGQKALHGNFEYMKAVEITALAEMISVLGIVITMFLVVAKGDASVNPGPILLLEKFDPQNEIHLLLSSLSITNLWFMTVLSIGLGKIANVKAFKAMAWIFGIWAVLRLLIIFSGFGKSGF